MGPVGISCPVAVMIVALRSRTAALGWRREVVGYCGRMTLLLSDATACGTGAGAAACRAPAVAQETDSASNGYKDRRMCLPPSGPGLLHEFDDERLSYEFGLHDPPGGLRGHVHR